MPATSLGVPGRSEPSASHGHNCGQPGVVSRQRHGVWTVRRAVTWSAREPAHEYSLPSEYGDIKADFVPTLWQRSTHLPLIFRTPGAQRAGVRRQPVTLLDLYPTLLDLCGLPPKDGVDGTSLAPLLRNPAVQRDPATITFLPDNHATVTPKWRYIRYRDGGEELYDRVADPNELRNLAGEPKHAALKQELAQFMPKTSAPPKPERSQYDFDFKTYTFRLRR